MTDHYASWAETHVAKRGKTTFTEFTLYRINSGKMLIKQRMTICPGEDSDFFPRIAALNYLKFLGLNNRLWDMQRSWNQQFRGDNTYLFLRAIEY